MILVLFINGKDTHSSGMQHMPGGTTAAVGIPKVEKVERRRKKRNMIAIGRCSSSSGERLRSSCNMELLSSVRLPGLRN